MIPENWVIRITHKNKPILQQYGFCDKPINYDYTIGAYYGNICSGDFLINEENVEINIDFFIKYIVNKETALILEDCSYLKLFLKKLNIK